MVEDAQWEPVDCGSSNNNISDNVQTRAIIAHITIIGWFVAMAMNNNEKHEFVSFYIRQVLGLIIVGVVGAFLQFIFIGYLINLLVIVLWVISLIGAVQRKKVLTPGIGQYFQDWFKSL